MDFAFAKVEVDVVTGEYTRELFSNTFCFKNNFGFRHGELLFLVWNAICGG